MNAHPKFLAATAHVDDAAVKPLPNSRKVYVGPLRVPMREVSQADTPSMFGGEKNPPIYVYDCSGPYTDPAAKIDIRSGLPALRDPWILGRADVQILSGPSTGKELELVKNLTTLGKPGIQVAVITRRPQGYFITHVEGANFPIVNGKTLDAQAHPLRDHDVVELAGVKMEFFLKGA